MSTGSHTQATGFDEFGAIREAIRLHSSGQFVGAESLCRQILGHNPKNPDALHLLGLLAHAAGQPGRAMELIQQAIGINPHDPNYHHNLGIIMESEGHIDVAIQCNERALYLDPGHFSARYSLANELRQLDRYERAVEEYKQALEIKPDHFEIMSNLGATLVALGETEEAITWYKKALALNPMTPEIHSNLGKALGAMDDRRGAQKAYEKSLELAQNQAQKNPNALSNLAALHLENGDLETAKDYIDLCLQSDPGNRSALALEIARCQKTGDHCKVSELLDFERFFTTVDISTPVGFESVQDFNADLVRHCTAHPTVQFEPVAKSTQRGYQSGELLKEPMGPVSILEDEVRQAVTAYIEQLSTDKDHPFTKHAPKRWRLSMWATILENQGHQSAHIHPSGWLSGVYYAKLPPSMHKQNADQQAGWIEFGRPPEELDDGSAESQTLEPREGRLYLFPSYFYHRTIPFNDDVLRVSIAFDVMPLSDAESRLLDISDTDIANMLGEVDTLYKAKSYGQCEAICARVLHADHDNHRALHRMGLIAHQNARFADAEDFYRRAIRVKDDISSYHVDRANVLRLLQRHEEAADAITRAVELGPRDKMMLLTSAAIFADIGQSAEARQSYIEVIKDDPDCGMAFYGLTRIETPGLDDPLVEKMKVASVKQRLEDKDLSNVFFGLGWVYHKAGDHDRAFECFKKGNSIRRELVPYDLDAEKMNTDLIIEAFTTELIEANRGSGSDSNLPVFVLGMPRSGTTLVEQILDSHPDVHGAGELNELWRVVSQIGVYLARGSQLPAAVSTVKMDAWKTLGESYISILKSYSPESGRIVDKLPFNYTLVGMIKLMMPNATIINCVRDPMDTCLSNYMTSFGHDRGFSNNLVELGETYRTYVRLMDHWKNLFPGEILDVQYEELVDDSENQIRKIVDHVDVEWSDRCLEFYKNPRTVSTASHVQVRKPIYRSAMGRWRKYERHLEPLQRSLGLAISD